MFPSPGFLLPVSRDKHFPLTMTPLRSSLFAILAATAIQAASPPLDSLNYVALLARQAPGTPQFDCHSNCGIALLNMI